ncbi:hypothetical protein [Spirillospora sp. NPDC029432]|uniref:hypothetical protein n=1 Tax=Spirillospora sp. NPDC029432 TaxID=3154599 RepID=UPI0034549C4C
MRLATLTTGLLVVAAGIGALLAGLGAFGPGLAERPLLTSEMARYAGDNDWFWPVAGGVAETVALAGLMWLGTQIRAWTLSRRAALDAPTRKLAAVAGGELLREARHVPGVRDARVRLTGSRLRPRLLVTILCAPDAAPAEIHTDLSNGPIERYRAAMDMDGLIVVIRFHMEDPIPTPPTPVPA